MQVSNSSILFFATQSCNAVDGCTPWTTYQENAGNSWPNVWVGDDIYQDTCSESHYLSLSVVNGTTPQVMLTDSMGCGGTVLGLGQEQSSFTSVAAQGDQQDGNGCQCDTVAIGGSSTNNTAFSFQGFLGNTCFFFQSQIYTFLAPNGETINGIFWITGGIGTNVE